MNADILVLGGLDYDDDRLALTALADRIGDYPHRFTAPSNRGRASGRDLDRDGRLGGPDDAFGYGEFRGADSLAILSRYPILAGDILDATAAPWLSLDGNIAPEGTTPDEPLSTTSHWRVPIRLPSGDEIAVVTWHATPPVFDGTEDRNGRRNHDEARLGQSLIGTATRPVIAAALANLDPVDGEGRKEAITGLLSHPALYDPAPRSRGAALASGSDARINTTHRGDPALDTTDWPDAEDRPGNLRTDYLLPDRRLRVVNAGILWSASDDPLHDDIVAASRHRVVWLDLTLLAAP